MASITEQLNSLILSAGDVKELTGWPDAMIEEWLNILRNIVLLASNTDVNVDQIEQNTSDISDNDSNITTNAGNITTNTTNISTNAGNISTNSGNISTNSGDITNLQNGKANIIGAPTTNAIITQTAGGDIQNSGDSISDLAPIVGTGNPNGVTTSNKSLQYIDDTPAGETLYFNTAVGQNTGWFAV